METHLIEEAIELLEKANADLQPELLAGPDARELLASYARVGRLADFGVASLTRKVNDPSEVARVTGTSQGQAKSMVSTGQVLAQSPDLTAALQHGDISLEQAGEIAVAEEACPGAAGELVAVAQAESFHVLREKSRKKKLEAEQHRDLFARQHKARSARSYSDDLGMVHIHMALEPHLGTPIVARAEAEAARLAKAAKHGGEEREPFESHLADAYVAMLSGNGKGRAKRPELVVLVSHEVAKRGWTDVREGEVCKIPGVGPVDPKVAKQIAQDAFLSGVVYDGKDLRNMRRWTRSTPIEVATALELGDPPSFDGVACVDCGNRFKTEFDHVEPHVARGPASTDNLDPRCGQCHRAKTERDRLSGKLKPPEP
jgi:5-methylcytosine-specific restriction endonuclease McrA